MRRRRSRSLAPLLAALAVLGASPAQAGINRFTPYGPGIGTVQALAVDPVTPGTLYALTDESSPSSNVSGEVYKSTDGAATWKWSSAGLPSLAIKAQALALDPVHPGTLYTSIGPNLFRSTDGAAHWVAVDVGWIVTDVFQHSTLAVVPGHPSVLFFTYGPHVTRSLDGGTTWTPIFDAPQEIQALLVEPAPATLLLGTAEGGDTWRSTDLGGSFTRVEGLQEVTAFAASTVPGLLYAASSGKVDTSTDGGALWSPRGEVGLVNALAVDPTSPNTVFAAQNAGISVSRDGGVTWRAARGFFPDPASVFYPSSVRALAADPARPGELSAGIVYRGVYRSTNSGRQWKAETQRGLNAFFTAGPLIHPKVPGTVYMTGGDVLWRSTDSGQSWEKRSGVLFDVLALDPQNPDILYGIHVGISPPPPRAFRSNFSRSTDGGATWSGAGVVCETLIWDLVIGKNTLVALCSDGIHRSTDGGRIWRLVLDRSGLFGWLLADPASSATFYFGTSSGGPIFRSRDNGATWQPFFAGNSSWLAIAPSRPSTLYTVIVGTTTHQLLRSTNGGRSWTEVGPIPVDFTKVIVDQVVPTTLYAATQDRAVWRSTDGGVTWTWVGASLVRAGRKGVLSLTAHPVVPHTFYANTGEGLFEARFED
jgi:photosystem II stability/assembly factor-like uncharacterized protein